MVHYYLLLTTYYLLSRPAWHLLSLLFYLYSFIFTLLSYIFTLLNMIPIQFKTIQGCARKDIVPLIFPAATLAVSTARFHRWIQKDPVLLHDLLKAGYKKGSHWFTPRVLRVLERYFL